MLDLKLREVEGEKNLYFTKLSQLDQLVSEAQSQAEVAQSPLIAELLSNISQIIYQEDAQPKEAGEDQQMDTN